MVLELPAWVGYWGLWLCGRAPAALPTVGGESVFFGGELTLEDPYLVAGVPLYLGLWLVWPRTGSWPWRRFVLGMAALELFGGFVLWIVGLCVRYGFTTSPRREPLEWLALASVSAIRVLPVLLWIALDPARPFRPRRAPRKSSAPPPRATC